MSGGCCNEDEVMFDGASVAYKRALWAVIAINAVMFVVEMTMGIFADSVALQADALDFLGDTATYTLSFIVIGMPVKTRSSVAFFKGVTLFAMGMFILGSAIWRVYFVSEPVAYAMGTVGLAALLANVASVLILKDFKDGDANVRSVWLCSRNDAIGNIAVVGAAFLVAWTGTRWPDLVTAIIMAGLFSWSSFHILQQSVHEYRHHGHA